MHLRESSACRFVPAVLLVLAASAVLHARPAEALRVDRFTGQSQPGNALVMPFDATGNSSTMLVASNVAGITPIDGGFILGLSTHWVFYDESGASLASTFVCLTLNDTVVVDPTNFSAINAGNEPVGPSIDLTGTRGIVVVTAYGTDEICSPPDPQTAMLIDDALVGRSMLSDAGEARAYGFAALRFGLNATGRFTDLPNRRLPRSSMGGLRLQTLAPELIDDGSIVVLLALKEKVSPAPFPKELAPLRKQVAGAVTFFDDLEIPTALPDLGFTAIDFTSISPGAGNLVPDAVNLGSHGMLALTNLRYSPRDRKIGRNTFLYAFIGEGFGAFSSGFVADYFVE